MANSPGQPRPIALTSGEPAGIGPDLVVALASEPFQAPIVVLGDRAVLAARAHQLRTPFDLPDYVPGSPAPWSLLHIPAEAPVQPGRLDPRNAGYVLSLLDRALQGSLSGEFAGMATAPVHKAVINQAGHLFSGHTENLRDACGVAHVVMLLVGGEPPLRVALATTHLPLAQVPAAITQPLIEQTLTVMHQDLAAKLGITHPRILVAGLNPHAGESGYLGREELDTIQPAIAAARKAGIDATGPLPADTLFTPAVLAKADAVLAMYHDQGLPVLKHVSFGAGVNVTLGLRFLRTSVDHGTALDLAGMGGVDPGSLHAALLLATSCLCEAMSDQSHRIPANSA